MSLRVSQLCPFFQRLVLCPFGCNIRLAPSGFYPHRNHMWSNAARLHHTYSYAMGFEPMSTPCWPLCSFYLENYKPLLLISVSKWSGFSFIENNNNPLSREHNPKALSQCSSHLLHSQLVSPSHPSSLQGKIPLIGLC